MILIVLTWILFLVSKPSSNRNQTTHVPPPRPAPPVVRHEPLVDQSDSRSDTDSPPSAEYEEPVDAAPPTAEFDFLNLGNDKPPAPEPPKLAKAKEPSFDLLGGFNSNFSDPFPDLVGSAMNKPTVPVQSNDGGNGLDDIFGSLSQSSAPTIIPSKSSSDLGGLNLNFGAPTAKSQEEAKKDPFADLTKTLHPDWSNASTNKPTPSPMGTQYSSPAHQFAAQQASSSASATPKNPSTPIHQMKSPNEPQRPDYSRSHFQDPQQQQTGGATKTGKSGDIFGDILGSQGYSFGSKTSQGPKTINAMRKVEQAQTMDPERLKIMEWVSCANTVQFECQSYNLTFSDGR